MPYYYYYFTFNIYYFRLNKVCLYCVSAIDICTLQTRIQFNQGNFVESGSDKSSQPSLSPFW